MEPFAIIFIAVVAVLLLVVLFGGKKQRWKKIVDFFVEEVEVEDSPAPSRSPRRERSRGLRLPSAQSSRNNQSHTEMAVLMQKVDERRRVVDSSGHSTLSGEYFELVFETRKGEILHLETSRASFKEVPFNQQGSLTHKRGKMIKFKYAGGLVSDEIPAE